MLIFLDTEFTDFKNRELISIGLITEDGLHEFYAERTDFNYEYCSDFVRSAVWAQLGEFPEAKVKKDELAQRLQQWLINLPYELTIACDSLIDWELMRNALSGIIPTNIIGYYDLRPMLDSLIFNQTVDKYHEDLKRPYHHALHDARASRLGWLGWCDNAKENRG
jgi:hypothetical protein